MSALADAFAPIALALTAPWRRPHLAPGTFGHAREAGRGPIVAGLVIMLVFETVPVHLALASRAPVAAWLFSASSVYLMLWLIGDHLALRRSRSRITAQALELRVGRRQQADIPLATIAAVRTRDIAARLGDPRVVRAVPRPGSPTLLIELSAPVEMRGMFGSRRRATTIAIAPDERAGFVAALAGTGVRVDPT